MKVGPENEPFDTSVPVVFGEYVKFDLYFDVFAETATLYINDTVTDVIDVPFVNPSDGVAAMNSSHVSDPGGSARWYLDNVSVVPEPATLCLLAVGSLAAWQFCVAGNTDRQQHNRSIVTGRLVLAARFCFTGG